MKIANMDQGQDKFFINVTDGQRPCQITTFTMDLAPSQKCYDRAFALVKMVLMVGKKVTVFSPTEECNKANCVEMHE